MKSREIRKRFLDFFWARGHELVPSSPLVPYNDPTLLFTNAGMVQFKEVFLGDEVRPYKRAASSQCCIRAGGKHNDLENVGYTLRHHTFFEMLGNFSFGDYFKREAIGFAWEFLTVELGLPPERLWISVFETDDETAAIWIDEIGIAPERLVRCGEKDNFWTMGDTGPCGPCTEIAYDHGPGIAGGPPGSPTADGDRFVEIWNLVFTQYDRAKDGTLVEIPRPSVDTGMGLERIAAVLQGVHSNYEIDIFRGLIGDIRALVDVGDEGRQSLQVIADHIRSASFLIAEGVLPGNEGRGYVLRRIIRRALRHGHKLGLTGEPFFHRLVAGLVREMGDHYPALATAQRRVEVALRREEERFAETLDQGLKILDQQIEGLSGQEIPGQILFRMYDTYGFPLELIRDIAHERGLSVDQAGFEREMAAQRERARAASHFTLGDHSHAIPGEEIARHAPLIRFTGYEATRGRATVLALFHDGQPVPVLEPGQAGAVLLDHTPFYPESGGQVADHGRILGGDGAFEVLDTRRQGGVPVHFGNVRVGRLVVGEVVQAEVREDQRQPTRCNHSATHLLHAALREVLGGHVAQKGSLVSPERLRFDFSHGEPLTAEALAEVERRVNEEIRRNHPVVTREMPIKEALELGAMALFGEKYDDVVRVLAMGKFSVELCGGTHVERTGDIGLLRIVGEAGVAAGIRRIEAVTGAAALAAMQEEERLLAGVAERLRTDRAGLVGRLDQTLERLRQLEKEVERLKAERVQREGDGLFDQAVEVGGIKVLAVRLDGVEGAALREAVDRFRDKLQSAAVVLAAVEDGKVRLVAGVTRDLAGRIHAGELVNFVASQVGGKGGGRPDLAQAGGTDASALPAALAAVPAWVGAALAKSGPGGQPAQ
jgi:alanyl-tRNA synthetase